MKLVYICIFLFFSLLSIAQEKATISGKISSNSEPVPFAFIYVQGGTQGTTANEEGSYQLEVPSGEMIIVVSAQGYRKVSKKINLPQPRQKRTLNFELLEDVLGT